MDNFIAIENLVLQITLRFSIILEKNENKMIKRSKLYTQTETLLVSTGSSIIVILNFPHIFSQ